MAEGLIEVKTEGVAARSPIVEILLLALPTVAQMASYTVMQFIDTYMLARVGPAEATASSNSGMFAFSIISLGMGVLFVVNTLVSQAYGRKDWVDCGRYLWQGIWFSLALALAFIPLLPFTGSIFRGFGHEPRLVQLETVYLQTVLGASMFKLVGTAFSQFLLATDRPMQVMFSTIGGVGANAVAAWILIFGRFGIAPQGVVGSAWGQNIGVLTEMTLLIAFALRKEGRLKYHLAEWKLRWAQMKTLIVVGFPSGVQIVADVLAWSLFTVWVMGQFGTSAMAANTFMFRYMVISFMPAFGAATAVTALVGRYIGRGEPRIAEQRAHLGFYLTAAYMVICGIVFFAGRNVLISLFTHDPEILRIGAELMIFAAFYQFFDAMYIVYNGALRGAGDTIVPAIATGGLCWGITVFGGYAVSRIWPSFGPAGPWIAASFYGVVLGVFMFVRFQRGKWKLIHLEPPEARDTLPGFDVLAAGQVTS